MPFNSWSGGRQQLLTQDTKGSNYFFKKLISQTLLRCVHKYPWELYSRYTSRFTYIHRGLFITHAKGSMTPALYREFKKKRGGGKLAQNSEVLQKTKESVRREKNKEASSSVGKGTRALERQ